ncbi:MAG: hypothetical protein Fues2KO_21610 [Fuerstiella sp.]
MWQQRFEQLRSEGFTIVGLALDAEGGRAAKIYCDRFGVTFPSLVDPNYATGFGAVPKTFFIDEHGKVLDLSDWEQRLAEMPAVRAVPDSIRGRWSEPERRTAAEVIADLSQQSAQDSTNPVLAAELGARLNDLGLHERALEVLQRTADVHDPRRLAAEKSPQAQSLAQVHLQLSRAYVHDREAAVKHATLSFFLNPSVGFGKQIARLIAPEKFDGRPDGSFDNQFREATLQRLVRERKQWLQQDATADP